MKLGRLYGYFWGLVVFGLGLASKVMAVGTFCDASGNPSDVPDLSDPRINTALGCIPAKADKFVEWLLPWVFGIAGGIAFLIMVSGFIKVATSKGDPKAIQAAKEMIGSAVTGLLVSVFALFILRLIAVDILHIPGMQ